MRRLNPVIVIVPLVLMSACNGGTNEQNSAAVGNDAASAPPVGKHASAEAPAGNGVLISADGLPLGTVQASDGSDGASLKIDARGLEPGVHGLHVHTTGKCEGPKFESAGAHWNPHNRQHGAQSAHGPHRGDLPNVTVAEDGRLQTTVTVAGAKLADLNDADGSALVLHARADDYKTDPSGNSGDRIACAVIGAPAGG